MESTEKAYTETEVAQHNKESDCWIILGNDKTGGPKAYDVTHFLADHPGGPQIILEFAGKNADDMFEDIGHSSEARKLMTKYLVGSVKVSSPKTDSDGKNGKKSSSGVASKGGHSPVNVVADEIAELETFLKSLKISPTKAGLWARELVDNFNIDTVTLLKIVVQEGNLESVFGSMQCSKKASSYELGFIRQHFIPPFPTSSSLSLLVSSPTSASLQTDFFCKSIPISKVFSLGGKAASGKSHVMKGEYFNTEDSRIKCIIKLARSEVDFETELRILEELNRAQQSRRETGCIAMYSSNTATLPYYLVLEDGGNSICNLLKPGALIEIIKVVAEKMLEAVRNLHNLGIVHLDIKPENIVYRNRDDRYLVKLIDFDSARHIGEPYPVIDGQLKYTANYACPEVALASDTSIRSNELMDYFSLGLVLWQLLNIRLEPILSTQWTKSSDERITLLTNQTALTGKLTFVHGTVYADDIRQMCSLDPSARVGSLDKLMSISSSQTSLHAANVKLQSEVTSFLQRIDARTTVLHEMSSFMIQQIADTEEVLRRAIFEGTEVKVPTCFVILNQKIECDPSVSKLDAVPPILSAASIEAKMAKAKTWADSLSSMFQTANTIVNGGAPNQSAVSTFMRVIGVEEVLYFYLIDEATGLPVVTEDGLYPIEINVATNKSFTSKMLPFLKLSYTAVSAINSVSGLARCLGYPVPQLSSETMLQFKSVVSRIDQQSSIAEFDALQSLATTADEVKQTVRGATLRELEQFYLQYDPQGQFCGLQRVCLSNGSAAERGAACWTLAPKLLHEAASLPPGNDPINEENIASKKSVPSEIGTAVDSTNRVGKQVTNNLIISCFRGCFLDRKQDFDTIVEHDHQNNSLASAVLAYLYSTGILVKADEQKAKAYAKRCLSWLQRCEDMYAQGIYGILMLDGVGDIISKTPTAAGELLTLSATQGFDVAQSWLGVCYAKGTGVSKDATEAVRWYRLAADQGNANAEYKLGYCFMTGKGSIKDVLMAVRYFRLAADQGHAVAKYNLGVCYQNGKGVPVDSKQQIRWYRLAADQGYAKAQNSLGVCYDHGTGVTQDATEAVRLYRLAADQGHAAAQRNLGVCYKNGKGVTQDATGAVRWFRLAADQGNADAQYNMGVCYENGIGVTQDSTEAVQWYKLAADQGDADAQYNMGVCYENGIGVTQDATEAVQWYRLAADQGNAEAQFCQGTCYAEGTGVTQDTTEAVRWFRLAADQGHAAAQEAVSNSSKKFSFFGMFRRK